MRIILLTGAVALIAASCSTLSAADPHWTKYTNKEAGFEAEFPDAEIRSANNPLKYGVVFDQSIFSVMILQIERPADLETAQKQLVKMRDFATEDQKLKLVSSKDILVDGNPGLELKSTRAEAKQIQRSRIVWTKSKIYVQELMQPESKDLTKEADRFFRSVKLIGTTPTATVQNQKSEWTKFTSKSGHFSAEFPGKDVNASKRGEQDEYLVMDNGSKVAFAITALPMDGIPKSETAKREILVKLRDNHLRSKQMTQKNAKYITVSGHPGIEFLATTSANGDQNSTVFRFVITDRSIYSQHAAGTNLTGPTKDVTRFFDSLKIEP